MIPVLACHFAGMEMLQPRLLLRACFIHSECRTCVEAVGAHPPCVGTFTNMLTCK